MGLSAPMADRPYLNLAVRPNELRNVYMRCRSKTCYVISCSMQEKLAIGEYRGILSGSDAVVYYLYEQCDTAHTLVEFAKGSTPVCCYDVRPINDTKKYDVQERWNVTMSGHL